MNLALIFFLLLSEIGFSQETVVFKVSHITCSSCLKSIREKLCTLEGLSQCKVKFGEVRLTSKNKELLRKENVQKYLDQAGEYKITEVLRPKP